MLAIRLDIAQTTVSGWENGAKRPSVDTVVRIADILSVSTDYLLGRTDNPLSAVPVDTPYMKVTPFEKTVMEAYRECTDTEQAMICRMLGLTHPAESRVRANRA